jgi:hypothetical protein
VKLEEPQLELRLPHQELRLPHQELKQLVEQSDYLHNPYL